MEFRGVYLLWFLLPLWYFFLTMWVFLRPLFKVTGKENLGRYGPSLIYSGVCLAGAIFIDQFGIAEALVDFLIGIGIFGSNIQVGILRFLLYPAVLVFGAYIQKFWKQEDDSKKRTLPKSKWSQ